MSVVYKRDIAQTILPKNKTSAIPIRFVVFDTETNPTKTPSGETHEMSLATVCYSSRDHHTEKWADTYSIFKTGKGVWDYIASLATDKKPLLVFAHNAFFDLTVSSFFPYFTYRGWKRGFSYAKDLTYILFIKKGKKTIKVVSTTNYFPASIKEMGKAISLEKIEIDLKTSSTPNLIAYCQRDTEIVVKYMQQYMEFISSRDLGCFAVTRASQAMNAYRHRFMPTNIYIHKSDEARELETFAYFGGRTECFRLGKIADGPFTTLDINSMYPYVMKEYASPTKLRAILSDVSIEKAKDILKRFAVVAKVEITTDTPIYAVRTKDKVVFPIGTFITGLCTGGLKEAIKRKHVTKILQLAYYDQDFIFGEYVDYFYGLRKEAKETSNKINDTYAKYCLNSLYGKFGQYTPLVDTKEADESMEYSREEIYDIPRQKMIVVTTFMNVTTTEDGREYGDRSLYAIPAHITEYARLLLWKIIEGIGTDKVLYCDTDSIKVRSKDMKYVKYPISQTELGALKIEHTTPQLIIFGLKDYQDGDEIKIKGIPKKATKNANGSYTYDCWLKQPSHLRAGESNRYIIQRITKTLSREYTKGRVSSSGMVRPLIYKQP